MASNSGAGLASSPPQLAPGAEPADSPSNGLKPYNIILTGDEALRTPYAPPEPTVKILKRPSRSSGGSGGAAGVADTRPTLPKKTLQQREQEYAEARLRIMGESSNSATELCSDDKAISIQKGVVVRGASGDVPPATNQPSVVRLPKGPDGTSGFHQQASR